MSWSSIAKKKFSIPSSEPSGNGVGVEGGQSSTVPSERKKEKEGGLLRLSQLSYLCWERDPVPITGT